MTASWAYLMPLRIVFYVSLLRLRVAINLGPSLYSDTLVPVREQPQRLPLRRAAPRQPRRAHAHGGPPPRAPRARRKPHRTLGRRCLRGAPAHETVDMPAKKCSACHLSRCVHVRVRVVGCCARRRHAQLLLGGGASIGPSTRPSTRPREKSSGCGPERVERKDRVRTQYESRSGILRPQSMRTAPYSSA